MILLLGSISIFMSIYVIEDSFYVWPIYITAIIIHLTYGIMKNMECFSDVLLAIALYKAFSFIENNQEAEAVYTLFCAMITATILSLSLNKLWLKK